MENTISPRLFPEIGREASVFDPSFHFRMSMVDASVEEGNSRSVYEIEVLATSAGNSLLAWATLGGDHFSCFLLTIP